MIIKDINIDSPIWNPYCHRKQNAIVLEKLIDRFDLLINNKPGHATRVSIYIILIIDLALLIAEFGLLTLWEIFEKYPHYPIMSS